MVAKWLEPVTKIGITTPLKTPAQPGKTFVWLNCDFVQCGFTQKGIEEATKALGWNLKVISYSSMDPASLISALQQALTLDPKPIGVAFSGIPQPVWESMIEPYRKAGVPILTGLMGPTTTSDAVPVNLWNEDDLAVDAEILANWVTADSGGKGQAVVFGVPDFPILGGTATSFAKALAKVCSGCKVTRINATIPQILDPGTPNQLVVSALQADPKIKYVITADGALMPGLPSAISGAGLPSDIKIGGALGTAENMQNIGEGTSHAFTGENFAYYGWLLVDVALRHAQGMEVPRGDGGMPHQLFTKANVATHGDGVDMKSPVGYQAQMKALWGVG